MKEFFRSDRVSEQIHRELAALLRNEVKNPIVDMVTVSAVEVSRDLSHAKVFVSTLKLDADREELIAALKSTGGFLRRRLGQLMKIRSIPQLHFIYDDSFDKAQAISSLIDTAVKSDANHETAVSDEPSESTK